MFMLRVHCSVIHSSHNRETTQCPPVDDLVEKTGIYTQWNIIQPLKRRKFCHSWQREWTRRAYAKWNTSDRERQILCDLTYMWNLKKLLIKKKKSRVVVARGLGSGSEELLVKGYKLPIMRWVSSGDRTCSRWLQITVPYYLLEGCWQ